MSICEDQCMCDTLPTFEEVLAPTQWILPEALELCTLIQSISPAFNCHPALTGGLLYKTGPRKDCDIVIYQRGDVDGKREPINWEGLWVALAFAGLDMLHDYGS